MYAISPVNKPLSLSRSALIGPYPIFTCYWMDGWHTVSMALLRSFWRGPGSFRTPFKWPFEFLNIQTLLDQLRLEPYRIFFLDVWDYFELFGTVGNHLEPFVAVWDPRHSMANLSNPWQPMVTLCDI